VRQQLFATPRDLEETGRARTALEAIPVAVRRRVLRSASGYISPYLRKRNGLPLTPQLEDLDADGMTGGAAPVPAPAAPTLAQDIRVVFTAGGTVGPSSGITYAVDTASGAYGSEPGPSAPLADDGTIVIDGVTWTLPAGGVVVDGDAFTYSTRVDPGVALATVRVAAYSLLGHGDSTIDPDLRREIKEAHDQALIWAKDLAAGEGDLEIKDDASPGYREGGVRTTGQRGYKDWVRDGRGRGLRDDR
jgi:hypothetical protein